MYTYLLSPSVREETKEGSRQIQSVAAKEALDQSLSDSQRWFLRVL